MQNWSILFSFSNCSRFISTAVQVSFHCQVMVTSPTFSSEGYIRRSYSFPCILPEKLSLTLNTAQHQALHVDHCKVEHGRSCKDEFQAPCGENEVSHSQSSTRSHIGPSSTQAAVRKCQDDRDSDSDPTSKRKSSTPETSPCKHSQATMSSLKRNWSAFDADSKRTSSMRIGSDVPVSTAQNPRKRHRVIRSHAKDLFDLQWDMIMARSRAFDGRPELN